MKVFLTLLITPILIFSQTTVNMTEIEQPSKKLYAKGALVFGPGFESIKVGEKYYEDSDKDPEDIEVMPGGGVGVEAAIGYDITKSFSLEVSIGNQNSGETVNDDKLQFKKALVRASALYKIQTEKNYTPYFGAGLSMVISAKYYEDTSAGEYEVIYNNPTGLHLLGGAEWKTSDSPLFFYGEVRVLILGEFEYDESDFDEWILEDFGMDKMTANGIQFSFGIGYYIN